MVAQGEAAILGELSPTPLEPSDYWYGFIGPCNAVGALSPKSDREDSVQIRNQFPGRLDVLVHAI